MSQFRNRLKEFRIIGQQWLRVLDWLESVLIRSDGDRGFAGVQGAADSSDQAGHNQSGGDRLHV